MIRLRDAAGKVDVGVRVSLYRDGKLVFSSDDMPLDIAGYETDGAVSARGVLQLGSDLPPGDYVLRAELTDRAAKSGRQRAAEVVQFEIVD